MNQDLAASVGIWLPIILGVGAALALALYALRRKKPDA
jgi:hypothetical protein